MEKLFHLVIMPENNAKRVILCLSGVSVDNDYFKVNE